MNSLQFINILVDEDKQITLEQLPYKQYGLGQYDDPEDLAEFEFCFLDDKTNKNIAESEQFDQYETIQNRLDQFVTDLRVMNQMTKEELEFIYPHSINPLLEAIKGKRVLHFGAWSMEYDANFGVAYFD